MDDARFGRQQLIVKIVDSVNTGFEPWEHDLRLHTDFNTFVLQVSTRRFSMISLTPLRFIETLERTKYKSVMFLDLTESGWEHVGYDEPDEYDNSDYYDDFEEYGDIPVPK